jgi:hypothetical protein
MLKFWINLLLLITFGGQPTFAKNQLPNINSSLAFSSKKFLGLQNGSKSSDKGVSKFSLEYDTVNSASQIALSYDGYKNFNLDGSYLEYTKGIATFGVGAVDRHWSFSNNSSLILSNNARPTLSVYLKLKNRFGYDWLPSKANWSFEAFNGFSEGSLNGSKSMLHGMRAILSPVEGLEFELIQTSQWGGNEYNNNISSLGAAIFTNSNDGSNSNINKMAGFGISYLTPRKIPFRIYGQAIGEDEAGNLPSCFAYLAGLEWINTKINYPTIVGIEAIDTRINTTAEGNCGPNTMYNNATYDYTNYGKTMGAEIDTEGTSHALYIRSQISQKINIEFTTKSVVINDNNWSGHRLSSKRKMGLKNSLSVHWIKNNIKFKGVIYNQDFNLDKANIKSGIGIGFASSIMF